MRSLNLSVIQSFIQADTGQFLKPADLRAGSTIIVAAHFLTPQNYFEHFLGKIYPVFLPCGANQSCDAQPNASDVFHQTTLSVI